MHNIPSIKVVLVAMVLLSPSPQCVVAITTKLYFVPGYRLTTVNAREVVFTESTCLNSGK